MTESQVQTVATFFFYALMDEKSAATACKRTLAECRKATPKNSTLPEDKFQEVFVKASSEYYEKLQKKNAKGLAGLASPKGWIEKAPEGLGPWKQFHRSTKKEELLFIIWNRVLKIPLPVISKALNMSEGTVSYRIGKALNKLGSMIHSDVSNA